jgi:hypothetical protein
MRCGQSADQSLVQFDPNDIRKSTVIITPNHAIEPIQRLYLGLPIKIQYTSTKSQYTTSLAHPPIAANYLPAIRHGTVGIVSFNNPVSQPLFIVWGQYVNAGEHMIWCKIFTLKELWRKLWPLSRGNWESPVGPVGEEGIAEVVDYVQQKGENHWLVQPPDFLKKERDERVVDTSPNVKVWVSNEKITFINRSVFRMRIHIEPHSGDVVSSRTDTEIALTTQR